MPITEKMSCQEKRNGNSQSIMDTWSYEDGQPLLLLLFIWGKDRQQSVHVLFFGGFWGGGNVMFIPQRSCHDRNLCVR